MNNKLFLGVGIGIVFVVSFIVFPKLNLFKKESSLVSNSEESKQEEKNTVPLPQEKDIINVFFQLIDEAKASDAVMMMTANITTDDSTKQAYGVQFAAMKSVKVVKIEDSSKADWTDKWHQYMVTLNVTMDEASANEPIPYYGFEKGENVRFINLVKEGSVWKIEGLSTGP